MSAHPTATIILPTWSKCLQKPFVMIKMEVNKGPLPVLLTEAFILLQSYHPKVYLSRVYLEGDPGNYTFSVPGYTYNTLLESYILVVVMNRKEDA